MSGTHSVLAPSAATRWARCAGALYMAKGMEQTAGEDAASGTASHWILEQCLKQEIDPAQYVGTELEFDGYKFKVDEARAARVRFVMVNIYREPGQMWVEKELNTSPVLGVTGQIGHADIVKLDPLGTVRFPDGEDITGVLSVHDFKDGHHKVLAQNNLQGLIYLAAALYEMDLLAQINVLRFVIHQPKVNHYDEYSYTRKQIEDFTAVIQPAAQLAYQLYNTSNPAAFDASKHLTPGSEQCQWCPVRGSCPARARRVVDLFSAVITKHAIDDERLGQLYIQLDEIEQACRDYRGEALNRAMMGRKIPGHKLVRGRRGARAWTDKLQAERSLSLILPDDLIYEPRKIVSPTQLQAASKDGYAVVERYVTQSDGQLTLVTEDDDRDEVTPLTFKPMEQS